jgi:hypothetical protein
LKLRSLAGHRPSPAIVISSAALFLSLGGVGYAATSLPSGSVGTAQLQSNAVTYQKVAPNSIGKVRLANGGVINSKLADNSVSYKDIQQAAVGSKRANLSQLQARVRKTCGAGSAIGAISYGGQPTCNATTPAEYGAVDATTALTSGTAATVASKALPSGSDYLTLASTDVAVKSGPAAQHVTVSCTLTVGSSTQTRTVGVNTDATPGDVTTASLPLQLASTSGTATESCTATIPAAATGTTVAATAGLNAIQTSSNN